MTLLCLMPDNFTCQWRASKWERVKGCITCTLTTTQTLYIQTNQDDFLLTECAPIIWTGKL